MKKLFCNLKPFLSYRCVFAVLSVVLPIAPFFIGSLIKNKRIHSELISL